MVLHQENNVVVMPATDGWATLIRKLRWIGLQREADRLEQAVRALPPEQRGTAVSDRATATDIGRS